MISMSPGDLPFAPTSTRTTVSSTFVIRIVAGPVAAAELPSQGLTTRMPTSTPASK